MNATSNPQTAAERAGNNYRDVTSHDAAVPEAVRDIAEKAVDQSREVNDRSKDALDASVATLERTLDAAGQGAVAFNRKIIDIAQRNVNSGFDLAKSLAALRTAPIWWSFRRPIGRSRWARLRPRPKKFARSRLNGLRRDGNTLRASADLGPTQLGLPQ
jgi:hypothetical protein